MICILLIIYQKFSRSIPDYDVTTKIKEKIKNIRMSK